MDITLRIVIGLIAALLIAYMLYRAFWTSPSLEEDASPQSHGSSSPHGGGYTEDQPDATGEPGSPSAE